MEHETTQDEKTISRVSRKQKSQKQLDNFERARLIRLQRLKEKKIQKLLEDEEVLKMLDSMRKPAEKPAEKPVEKPAEKPAEKPVEKPPLKRKKAIKECEDIKPILNFNISKIFEEQDKLFVEDKGNEPIIDEETITEPSKPLPKINFKEIETPKRIEQPKPIQPKPVYINASSRNILEKFSNNPNYSSSVRVTR